MPFSNRIARGRFTSGPDSVRIDPNFPGQYQPHPLHGFGWLMPWTVARQGPSSLILQHDYQGADWPWAYRATEELTLGGAGLTCRLSLSNLSDRPMPAGLGLHPYFPRTPRTRYLGLHKGEWTTGEDGLPISLSEAAEAVDWWREQPVGERLVDTVYTGRRGDLVIDWPERGLQLTIRPSPELSFTVVYVPPAADFFCVEPVSHMTDAFNRDPGGFALLGPGEQLSAEVRFIARRIREG